ncbi:MAG: toprim domain-containing protein [Puniceicoccaceae bacterium]|nr:toprim domain-containing protein [Puniceicoccaceae bacterium]
MLLKENNPKLLGGETVHKSTVPKLEAPVAFDADDQTLLNQIIDYYQERLRENPAALEYLKKRGLDDPEALKAFQIGYADRTLGLRLPHKNRKDGQEIRDRLTKIGLYRDTGHEHFNGCLVFPIVAENGAITEVYGRKANEKQKNGIYHLYLPGPHRGLLNPQAFKSSEVILTESVIDALTFWIHGFKNVTCIYGTEGFTDDHLDAFKSEITQRVYFAYDRDKAGDRAAERDAAHLSSLGIECFRVQFPSGMDANQYALKVTPPKKSLQVLLNAAVWLKKPSKPKVSSDVKDHEIPSTSTLAANKLAAKDKKGPESEPQVSVESAPSVDQSKLKKIGEDYVLSLHDRSYRIRGLQKNSTLEVLKVNLRVMHEEWFHLDTLDFYRAKDRHQFITTAAHETGLAPELLKRDMGKLLLQLEALQEKLLESLLEVRETVIELTEEEKVKALDLLKSPKLLDRILEDFANCGIVGEATNKLTGYLAAVSRKLDKPLAIIIQSTSAAGKTSLMESVLAMMPEEERIKYSAMTGQSLYYLGETNLKHKILAIVEEEGAEKASYALKLLQSEGELTIASTGKDEQGRMKTEEYHVEGPVMIFLTTTAVDIDEELLNRCLVLTVDEGKDQTGAVHTQQRSNQTLYSLAAKSVREETLKLHQNAQRLLKPVNVVNPYAPYLTFRSDRTRFRRDHIKYLTLINCIALLHQYQRPLKEQNGYSYIEVNLQDIEIANKITQEVIGRSLEELSPQGKRFLKLLIEMVENLSKARKIPKEKIYFSRRQIREHTGWSEYQVRTHTQKLRDLEYLSVHGGNSLGASFVYELIYDGGDLNPSNPMGLTDVSKLQDIKL